jgi:hypothetical protein
MPAGTALSRIGRFEFIALLGPGVYLTVACALGGGAVYDALDRTNNDVPAQMLTTIAASWPLATFFFFIAYLTGSALRACSVTFVDRYIGSRFKFTASGPFQRALYESNNFPYLPMLEHQLEAIRQNRSGLSLQGEILPPVQTAHTVFNLWKTLVCGKSTALFEYTQELESRVRLFSGMLWASALALVPSAAIFVVILFWSVSPKWLPTMIVLVFSSLLFFIILGWRLRHVRGEEAVMVFLAYLSLR